jgi:hypothetical protein
MKTKREPGLFRFGISTTFLAVALVDFPFAVLAIGPPQLFARGSQAEFVLEWLVYHFLPSFFVVAFIAAVITLAALAVRRRWRSMPQHFAELLVSFVCAFSLPAY